MRVLLFGPRLRLYRRFVDYPHYLHLNTLTAAELLRRAGHEVSVLDTLFHTQTRLWPLNDRYFGFGIPFDDLRNLLPAGPFDALVVMNTPFTNLQWFDEELTSALQRLGEMHDCPALLADAYLGGQHRVDVVSREVLARYGFSGYAQDEAEGALLPLLEKALAAPAQPVLTQGGPADAPQPLPLQLTPEQVLLQREIVSRLFQSARRRPDFAETGLTLATHTSRGCVYSCAFCTSNPAGDKKSFRPFDLNESAAYWKNIQRAVGLERLVVLDELANGQPAHFEQLLDTVQALGVQVSFPNGLRADRLTREQVRRLSACCPRLSVSAESASPDVREGLIHKRLPQGKIEQVARWCHEDKLPLLVHYMVGHAQETPRQINETFEEALSLKRLYGADPAMQVATPLPGSRFYAQLAQQHNLTQAHTDDFQPWFHTPGLVRTQHFSAPDLARALRLFQLKKRSLKPEKIILNLTYVCNNQCTFCATGNRFKGHANLTHYISLLTAHYQKGIRLVDFDGGEPTLYPHFLKVIRHARQTGYEKINLTTNGRLLAYEETARKVLASGLTELLISFHGHTAGYHEHQTQAPGSYAQTLAGIRNMLKLSGDALVSFGVNFTLTAHNAPIVRDYIAFVADLGVRRVNLQFVTPFGRANPRDVPDPAVAAGYVSTALDEFGGQMDIQVINLPFCFLKGHEQHLSGDVAKAARTMVFVSEQEVNLAGFLEVTRHKTEACQDCLYSVACDGFYDFSQAESLNGPVPLNTAQVGGRI